MKTVTNEVIAAVTSLKASGWEVKHLLNVSEFIDVLFENAGIHSPGEDADIIANYLAEDEENIIPYATYVLNGK